MGKALNFFILEYMNLKETKNVNDVKIEIFVYIFAILLVMFQTFQCIAKATNFFKLSHHIYSFLYNF